MKKTHLCAHCTKKEKEKKSNLCKTCQKFPKCKICEIIIDKTLTKQSLIKNRCIDCTLIEKRIKQKCIVCLNPIKNNLKNFKTKGNFCINCISNLTPNYKKNKKEKHYKTNTIP